MGSDKAPSGGEIDVVVVGAGFAGLYMLYCLRHAGFNARVLEAGNGIGGTWFWNRYPGARCDIESLDYSYKFSEQLQMEWTWTERYAPQPEILQYINYVADKFDLRKDVQLETRVTAATFDSARLRWWVTTEKGQDFSCRHVVMATGCLSSTNVPQIEGLGSFEGELYHTGLWPHEPVSFEGKRVGVIGTGSSAIQAIPSIAKQAETLTVFQRTPNFSLPAVNRPLHAEDTSEYRQNLQRYRDVARNSRFGAAYADALLLHRKVFDDDADKREQVYQQRWELGGGGLLRSYDDLMTDPEANATAAEFVRRKIRKTVKDPVTADALCPTDHFIGSKRICVDIDYFQTFNQPNVRLVNLKSEPIERVCAQSIRTSATDYEIDALVLATGFDAVTGALLRVDIRGEHGIKLSEKWRSGPRTYLGLMTHGFPNFFMITGPGSPSVLGNVIVSIEEHVEWILGCLNHLRACGLDRIENDLESEDQWVQHVNELADTSLLSKVNNWYVGANIPGKPRVFLPYVGGTGNYRSKLLEVAKAGYRGFNLSAGNSEPTRLKERA